MKETKYAVKSVGNLILTAIYACLSYDAVLLEEIADFVTNKIWKKFWKINSRIDKGIAGLVRRFC